MKDSISVSMLGLYAPFSAQCIKVFLSQDDIYKLVLNKYLETVFFSVS